MSQSPGRTVRPRASIFSASGGIATVPSGPTAVMRLPDTRTVIPACAAAFSESKTLAPVSATG